LLAREMNRPVQLCLYLLLKELVALPLTLRLLGQRTLFKVRRRNDGNDVGRCLGGDKISKVLWKKVFAGRCGASSNLDQLLTIKL